MSVYHLDFETSSECPIRYGAFRYASDPSTRILMFAVCKDDGDVYLWDFLDPRSEESLKALSLLQDAVNQDSLIYAHNVGFELAICEYRLEADVGIHKPNVDQWRCTQFMCRRAGIPPSLAEAAKFLQLPQKKDTLGKTLIHVFSDMGRMVALYRMPAKYSVREKSPDELLGRVKSPVREPQIHWDALMRLGSRLVKTDTGDLLTVHQAWKSFKEYCRQDVRVEREIQKILVDFEPAGEFLAGFQFDLRLNLRGVPVDVPALKHAHKLIQDLSVSLNEEFVRITGLLPSQRGKCLAWMRERGYPADNLQSATVEELSAAQESAMTPECRRALAVRSMLSFAAVKKIPTMLDWVCPDGRIRGAFIFHGAQKTGRWTSTGPQFQNMKKPPKWLSKWVEGIYADIQNGCTLDDIEGLFGNPYEVIASLSRYFVRPDGQEVYDADFAQVEARILPALIQCQRILDKFIRGEDPYADVAKSLNTTRQMGKVISLLCIARGQLVLTDSGLIPIEEVQRSHSVWDGEEWVSHEGVTYKGKQRVIEYQGLRATPEHEVYVYGEKEFERVAFAEAKRTGRELVTPSNRVGGTSRKGEEEELERDSGEVEVYDILNAGPRHRFTVSGKLVSNCQFGGGWRAVKIPLKDRITETEARKAVKVYREENPEVVKSWRSFQEAFLDALGNPGVWCKATESVKFKYVKGRPFDRMLMRLPSGRDIVYPKPAADPITMVSKVTTVENPKPGEDATVTEWSRIKGHVTPVTNEDYFHSHELSFYGHVKGGSYGRVPTRGSDCLQSATQGTGVDLLLYGCVEAERQGFEPFLVVHDQALAHAHGGLEEFISALCTRPPWFPDFPLEADGGIVKSYCKD